VTVPVSFTVSTQAGAAPTAAADAVATDRDIPVTVPAPGVLANDRGVGPLTAQVVVPAVHGSVVIGSDGGLTYTPGSLYIGDDAFTYRTTDGLGRTSAPATVAVTVRDIPHVALSATAVQVAGAVDGSVQAPLQITNSGGGTLLVSVVDAGSGGSPGSLGALGRLAPKTSIFSSSALFCYDGQGYWTYLIGRDDLIRIDATTGAELERMPHGIQDDGLLANFTYGVGIAWTGSRVVVVDRGIFGANPSGAGGQVLVTRPRIRFYDPVTRTQTGTIEVPIPLFGNAAVTTGLAYDPAGFLWCAAGPGGTFRIAVASGAVTAGPALANTDLGQLEWYDGSLWAKDRATIKRFNPSTAHTPGVSLKSMGQYRIR
jgi:hypothetical protein